MRRMTGFPSENPWEATDERSVCEWLLSQGLDLTQTPLGNVQLIDWKEGYLKIVAQTGFREDFLKFFAKVKVCGRVCLCGCAEKS